MSSASDRGAVVRRGSEVPSTSVAAGTAAEVQVLIGPADGAPHFVLRRFRMGAGGGMPRHTNEVEHEQFVLAGKARVTVGQQVHEVSAGDVLFIPAGLVHAYQVIDGPFEFLCIVPNTPDKLTLLGPAC